ncbi:MAG: molybdopterin molybdotransferase MoeA [Alphaproteobacteria bacterium]|tara:strand:+ start:330 stop:1580 length:1251 start_codon:yes stop_codon:yes gene_type:complete
MTQLTKDLKAFGNKLVKLDTAIKIIKNNFNHQKYNELINIKDSLNRISSENIISSINVPAYSNSAVDGYAINFKEYSSGNRKFNIIGKSSAGHPFNKKIKKLSSIRVLTGAMLPSYFDTIIMEEDCEVTNDILNLPNLVKKSINYRYLGEDIKKNSIVYKKGHKIKPQDIGVLASLGFKQIKTYKVLRIAIFSSGDELTNIGKPLKKGHIYDSNREMIISFLNKLGFEVTDLGILKDKTEIIKNKLKKASTKNDLIITTGGMSLGDEDHIKNIIDKNGSIYAWRLAIKPGRPVGFGKFNKCPIIGLPGNPAAAFITFLVVAIPILKQMSGQILNKYNLIPIISDFYYTKKRGRKEFIRVKLINKKNKLTMQKFPRAGAGILTSATWSSGIGILNEKVVEIKPGDKIDYLSYNEIIN